MVYLKELYTVVPTVEPGNNPCGIYFVVLQFLLDLYEKEDNAIDADLLQILAIEWPLNKTIIYSKKINTNNIQYCYNNT